MRQVVAGARRLLPAPPPCKGDGRPEPQTARLPDLAGKQPAAAMDAVDANIRLAEMQAERGQHPVQGGVERPGDVAEQVAEQL